MDPSEYQNLFNFIASGSLQYPADFPDKSTKQGKNRRDSYKAKAKKYYLQDNVLYRFIPGNVNGAEVVIDGRQNEILREFHGSAFGGHSGVNRTVEAIRLRYWWYGLTADVKNFIKSCDRCQKSDPLKPPQKPELQSIQVTYPFELVGVDLVGPLTETVNGNKYIFTATDYYIKWVEAFPIKSKTAVEVCGCFEKLFSRHGAMNAVLTDQGREFNNELNTKLCEAWNIKHKVTAAYHPQTNGLDERTNQTIKGALRKLTNEHQTDWDTFIDGVLFSIRSKPQSSTKFSPFYLLYGREATYPSKLPKNFGDSEELPTLPSNEMIERNVKKRQESESTVHASVLGNIKKAQSKQQSDYEKRKGKGRSYIDININDKVLVHNSRKASKKSKSNFESNYNGPYVVVGIEGKLLTLKNGNGEDLKAKVNVDRVKKFNERCIDQPETLDAKDMPDNSEKGNQGTANIEVCNERCTDQPCNETSGVKEMPDNSETSNQEAASDEVIQSFLEEIRKNGMLQQLLQELTKMDVPKVHGLNMYSHLKSICPLTSFIAEVSNEAGDVVDKFGTSILPFLKDLDISLSEKASVAILMANVCTKAAKIHQPVTSVLETLKLTPSHLSKDLNEARNLELDSHRRMFVAGETLEEEDLESLRGNNWLTDKVINAFLNVLKLEKNQGETHVFVLPSYTAVLWDNGKIDHWLFKKVKFSFYENILMPINVNENHWILLFANVVERRIGILDSLNGTYGKRYLQFWSEFMKRREVATGEHFGSWTVDNDVMSNKQTDGSSCGIFTLMNAECIIKRVPHEIMRQVHVKYHIT